MTDSNFVEAFDNITQNWILKIKRTNEDGLNPTLITSTDKMRYREFVFLNMGGLLAKKYNYKTLLLDLNPYNKSFHSQFTDATIENIQHDDVFDERKIINVDSMLSFGILFDDANTLKMITNKNFSDFIHLITQKYDAVLINTPQVSDQIKMTELLVKIIPNALLVIKENVSNKKQVRSMTSKLKMQNGNNILKETII